MMGIGGPQYRCREMHQSWSRYWTRGVARPRSASQATIFPAPSRHGMPSNGPEFMSTPFSATVGNVSPSTATTCRIGRLNCVANSKSRLSCAGTAMMAPAVLHEDVVGDPDRDRFARRRVAGVGADEDARLRLLTDSPRHDVLRLHFPLICLDRRALLDGGELIHKRVLGREDQIGCAEDRVGPGREDHKLLAARRLEDELRPFAPADPVPLK